MQDELLAKQQLYEARQREIKLEKRLKIVDVLQTICYIAIPALIILIGVWYFVDLKTALYILIPLSIVGVVIGLLLKKLINKFNDKLDKISLEYDKKPNEFIDTDLFFDKNYILDIIKNK